MLTQVVKNAYSQMFLNKAFDAQVDPLYNGIVFFNGTNSIIYRNEVMNMVDTGILALAMGISAALILIALIWFALEIVARWKIFTKAGEDGWKSIIPFYSTYIQYKLSWNVNMFWAAVAAVILGSFLSNTGGALSAIGTLLSAAGTIINIIDMHKLSKSFGHGIGFTIGLIVFNPIFMLILGFGDSQYIGPQ